MGKILIIEDSPEIVRILKDCLKNFELYFCTSLKSAKDQIEKNSQFDMILLDVGLPDGDGFSFLTSIRNQAQEMSAPVIFLTSRSDTADIIMGFSLGAEDYISKPFNPFELKARIEAKMKIIKEREGKSEIIQVGELKLNLATHKAFVSTGTEFVDANLTPLEFKIISFFAKNADHVFTRDQLIDQIWGSGISINDRAVDTHMSNLRKKIKMSGYTIQSIYGTGYALRKISQAA
jgi:two-component system phosphate regulon response regulator PhoB